MPRVINIHAAKTHFSRLVEQAAAGEEIIIARGGEPKARLVPLAPRPVRRLGLLRGKIEIAEDFDAPLPPAVLKAFYDTPVEPGRTRR